MPTIKQLNEEIGEIIKTNQTYFEKVITLPIETIETIEEEEQPVDEEIYTNPYFANNIDFLNKQREELDAFMSELMNEVLYVTDKENSIEENIEENIEEDLQENKQEL
jgi:hypothetical protein